MSRAAIGLIITATICAMGASGDTPLRLARNGQALVPIVVADGIKPAADQRGKAWAVEIAKAPSATFEDYQLLLDDELPPYLATSPEGLLMPSDEAQQ